MPRSNLPASGQPDSLVERVDDGGKLLQKRYYGPDGRALKNVDFDHDHGAGLPHAHDWDWKKTPPRSPGRPLLPGE